MTFETDIELYARELGQLESVIIAQIQEPSDAEGNDEAYTSQIISSIIKPIKGGN
jgi:hypothetical protein